MPWISYITAFLLTMSLLEFCERVLTKFYGLVIEDIIFARHSLGLLTKVVL